MHITGMQRPCTNTTFLAAVAVATGLHATAREVGVQVSPLPSTRVHVVPAGLRALGQLPTLAAWATEPPRGRARLAGSRDERVFLDLGLCFNRSVRLVALDVGVADPEAFHAGRFTWRLLHPIPSRTASATQWFRLQAAWGAMDPRQAPQEAFPTPGTYRLHLDPPPLLGFGDCVGWSLQGGGDGPLFFHDGGPGQVAWASSSDGLHDVVELFVKRGTDPHTARERDALHIEWTGLQRRTYALRLLYEAAAHVSVAGQEATRAREAESAPVVEGGNPACWRGDFTFQRCCAGDARDSSCWDTFFNFERCCTLTTVKRFTDLDFSTARGAHYELPHLLRDNAPRLGPVQDDEALLLYGLVRATRPRTIVEFGTANGFSAMNWMHAIADDVEARVYSYDILPYPSAVALEDADPRFIFLQKSQADFEASDVDFRVVDLAFFDAGHLIEYSLKAFERLLGSLGPTAIVAVHDTGLHVLDHGAGAPPEEEGLAFSEASCARRSGGAARCRRFAEAGSSFSAPEAPGGAGRSGALSVGRAHRPSERAFVRRLMRQWPEWRALHVHSRRVFRHGLTLLQRGDLWDPDEVPTGDF